MQLSVGPVAIVSLLTGSLLSKYNVNFADDPSSAVEAAGQAALSVGIIFMIMSFLRMGQLINFMSHSVISGFTTAAAFLIGLNQLKSAFGFTNSSPLWPGVPQQGQTGYPYNYQVMRWYKENWYGTYTVTSAMIASNSSYKSYAGRHYRNFIATRVRSHFVILSYTPASSVALSLTHMYILLL